MLQTASEKLRSAVLRVAARNSAVLALHTAGGAAPSERVLAECLSQTSDTLVAAGPLLGEAFRQQLTARGATLLDAGSGEREPILGLDDLETDPSSVAQHMLQRPISTLEDYLELQRAIDLQRRERPRVADNTFAAVLADSTLNAYSKPRARAAVASAFRVLARGGKLVTAVLVCDEPLKGPLAGVCLSNGELIRCVPGETEVLEWLDAAGFHGIGVQWRGELPFGTCAGSELRYHVITAYKGKQGACIDHGHALIYRGPWSSVTDDDGHSFVRGVRAAVCAKTFGLLTREPYAGQFLPVSPYQSLPEDECPAFDCNTPQVRDPAVSKGLRPLTAAAVSNDACAAGDGSCC